MMAGDLTLSILEQASFWAFHGERWLDVRPWSDLGITDEGPYPVVSRSSLDAYSRDTLCYPCRLTPDGTVERIEL